MRARLLALAAAAAAAALAAAGPGAVRAAVPAGNLLQDAGAESAGGGQIPGWTLKDGFTAVDYGNPDGFPSKEEGVRIGGGRYFFTGGVSSVSSAAQRVDVAAAADRIDAGQVQAQLTGQLGGFAGQDDHMDVTVSFLGASGSALGKLVVAGPRGDVRKAQTVMVLSKGAAKLPLGTRAIEVLLTSTRESGSWNDGYADNLSLALVDLGGGTTAAPSTGGSAAASSAGVPGNLVVNPGAEQLANGRLPGWVLKDGFTGIPYTDDGTPGVGVAKAIGGGVNLFSGGVSARSTATQVIDVTSQAAAIDKGALTARLSAYVGGYASQPDWAKVYATFSSAAGKGLGAIAVGPVTPEQRKGETTLLYRAAALKVPPGTRSVTIAVVAVRGAGSWNDGDVDNIALTLGTGAAPAPAAGGKPSAGAAASGAKPAAAGSASVATYRAQATAICTEARAKAKADLAKIGSVKTPAQAAALIQAMLGSLSPLLPKFKALQAPPEFLALEARLVKGLDAAVVGASKLITLMRSGQPLDKAAQQLGAPVLTALGDVQAGFKGMGLTTCEGILEDAVAAA